MRKIVLASALAIAATTASAGNLSPVVPETPVEVVPAPVSGGSLGGIWGTVAIVGLVGALIAAANSSSGS